jgi:hypothetical protein
MIKPNVNMNDYLGKEYNEATTGLFNLLHQKVDLQKRHCFQILHSNVNISKYGYQNERKMNGFLDLDSEDLMGHNDTNAEDSELKTLKEGESKPENGDHVFGDETVGVSEEEVESESDSEMEQMELNKMLKEGKSGAQGIKLGENSLRENARVLMTRTDDVDEFEVHGDNNHFESFEQNEGVQQNSDSVNPLFKNQEKAQGMEKSNLFEEESISMDKKAKDTDVEMSAQRHEIEVENGEEGNDFRLKLSFANDSFNRGGNEEEVKMTVDSEKIRVQSSFELEQKKDIGFLLSSKTVGDGSPKTSNMYTER